MLARTSLLLQVRRFLRCQLRLPPAADLLLSPKVPLATRSPLLQLVLRPRKILVTAMMTDLDAHRACLAVSSQQIIYSQNLCNLTAHPSVPIAMEPRTENIPSYSDEVSCKTRASMLISRILRSLRFRLRMPAACATSR